MTRSRNYLRAERLTAFCGSTECGGGTGMTLGRRSQLYSCPRQRRRCKTLRSSLWELSSVSTTAARVPGFSPSAPGMNNGLDWQTLTAKYLTREQKGIWCTDSEKVRAMYRALRRLDASEQTIFLLVVELGTIAEAARRLKVHRSTVTRIYNRIKNKIGDEVGRY